MTFSVPPGTDEIVPAVFLENMGPSTQMFFIYQHPIDNNLPGNQFKNGSVKFLIQIARWPL
jgi:hypothetical protein